MLRILIHGITNQADAAVVAKLGADGIGFILDSEHDRYIEYTLSRSIVKTLPPMTSVYLQPEDISLPVLKDLIRKLRIHSLMLPVARYEPSLEELGCRIVYVGTAARILDFVEGKNRKYDLLPVDLLLSILLNMDSDEREYWREINQDHNLYIPCEVLPEQLPVALEVFKPAVLCFEGTTESHTGLQDYPLIQEYVQAVHSIVERV